MATYSAPDDIRGLTEQVCAQMGLDEFAANTVEKWVQSPPSQWDSCCMGDCDPCNDVIRAAARKVLEHLNPGPHRGR